MITTAGNLAARYVIHAVGPVWRDGTAGEEALLAAAYRRSLELSAQHGCRSIALPALSAGAYRFPLPQAARVGLSTAKMFLETSALPELARFVLFDQPAFDAFAAALAELGATEK